LALGQYSLQGSNQKFTAERPFQAIVNDRLYQPPMGIANRAEIAGNLPKKLEPQFNPKIIDI
jgi:hypothetical protein